MLGAPSQAGLPIKPNMKREYLKNMMFKVSIEDKSKNKYFYFPEFNVVLPKGMIENRNNKIFLNKLFNFLDKIKKGSKKIVVSGRGIKRALANVRNLLLEISEACNLRCRYCVYSGAFVDRRKHSEKLMNWEVARSAIDFFMNWVTKNERLRYHPFILSVGFYGGEPLLNFDVLKKSVSYGKRLVEEKIKRKFELSELNFDMTTNGLLLDEEKMEFFIQNNFRLLISIDGPPEIHNQNKGKGSFENLFPKIVYIYEKYPEFYNNNLSYSVVYAKDTDLEKVRDFFSQDIFEKCKRINFGYVVDDHSSLIFPQYGLNEKRVIEEIIRKKRERVKLYKIEEEILKVYFNINLNTLITKGEGLFGAKCILGSKTLFVRVNGDFDGCEKVGDGFKIGNIMKGFNFKRIMEIEKEWSSKTTKCKACPVQAFCTACFASVGFKGKIEIMNSFCKDLLRNYREKMHEYIELQKI